MAVIRKGGSYYNLNVMAIKQYRYTKLHLAAAFLLAVLGVVLIISAMFIPPMGYIDPTVLTAFGELLTFCAALAGMDYRNGKVTNIKTKNNENHHTYHHTLLCSAPEPTEFGKRHHAMA